MIETTEAYGLTFAFPAGDTAVGACLRDYGEFARPELDLISTLATGDLLDVGANIGAICLPFARLRPRAAVVAVEAHPQLAALLERNARSNRLANVSVISAAAGEAAQSFDMAVRPLSGDANFGALSLLDASAPRCLGEMVRLDDVAPPSVSFVKIDVEGFEPRVLHGSSRLLHDARPSWLVEVSQRRQDAATDVRARLEHAGYRLFWFFSPFLTRKRPKRLDERPKMRGDVSILAIDGDPAWNMRPVTDEWPRDVADFPYLAEYGLVSGR
jgi:FkbM family methyltransferase